MFVLRVMSHSEYDLDDFERVANQMSTSAQEAVATLSQLLLSHSETIRLQAARCFLHSRRLRDAMEVRDRVCPPKKCKIASSSSATGRSQESGRAVGMTQRLRSFTPLLA